jgi:hypothetical protein
MALSLYAQMQSDVMQTNNIQFTVLEKRQLDSSDWLTSTITTGRAAVVVEPNVRSTEGRDDVFYQVCGYTTEMLDRTPSTVTEVYGIVTDDYQVSRFMKLDRQTKRIVCSKGFPLVATTENPKEFDVKSVITFAYLFEVFIWYSRRHYYGNSYRVRFECREND